MKKQNIKSLRLNKKSIFNFQTIELKGGRTGNACGPSKNCQFVTVVHTCGYSCVYNCSLSIIQCNG